MSRERQQTGAEGEDRACRFLEAEGFQILVRNQRTKFGEIDVIVRRQNRLCFVEIKTRKTNEFGPAYLAVSPTKQAKIKKSAQWLLMQNPAWQKLIPYFSVLTIEPNEKIEFILDGFQ